MYMEKDSVVLKQRRRALRSNQKYLGLDYAKLKTAGADTTLYHLELHFIGAPNAKALTAITPDNIVITAASVNTPQPFTIVSVSQPTTETHQNLPASVLASMLVVTLKTSVKVDMSTESIIFTASFINVANVDPFFASVSFRSQENLSTNKDCRPSLLNLTMPEVMPGQEANTNYLAKDYASFRQLMLTRLAQLIPDWPQDNPADFGNVIVEILAYAADQLSYYQDAVATEAYLSTARKRLSVRRHARLLNYRMHEGCNARVWTQIQTNKQFVLPKGSALLTKTLNNYSISIPNITLAELAEFAAVNNCLVFTTLYPINVYPEHNAIPFYLWGNASLTLPIGTTKAILQTHLNYLQAGDVLIFEEIQNDDQLENLSVARRHAVRLLSVELTQDALASSAQSAITQITWHSEDALPFDFNVTENSVARGNIVLADQGLPIINEALMLETVDQNTYSATFKQNDLTFCVPFNADISAPQSATQLLQQDPHFAQPSVELWQADEHWSVKPDLLNSTPQSQDFVVEMENNRQAFIRFGDGVYGKVPAYETTFNANYRSGNGSIGNIGAEALSHIVIFASDNDSFDISSIVKVRNPLPAQGGVDYEPLAQVKQLAPHAFTTLQRCVVPQDYVQILEQHPQVKQAAAISRWTGSWNTLFIAVERKDHQALDEDFKQMLLDYLNSYRIMGQNIVLISPKYVQVNIALVVKVKSNYSLNSIRTELYDRIDAKNISLHQHSFFHPENFGFGDSVYLSQLVAEVMTIPGVAYVDMQSPRSHFDRLDKVNNSFNQNNPYVIPEYIPIDALEIAQVMHHSERPEQGQISFYVEY